MRLLADENVPLVAVEALRRDGHDVAWVRADAPGSGDPDVLRRAAAERRVLVTFDKDIGELAFRAGLPSECGVVLFRWPPSSAASLAAGVSRAMATRADWSNAFSIVEPGRIRVRPLPGTPPGT